MNDRVVMLGCAAFGASILQIQAVMRFGFAWWTLALILFAAVLWSAALSQWGKQ